MKNRSNRRSFLKILIAFGSTISLGLKNAFAENSSTKMKEKIVKNIEPLGFQWKARDPFLFCVHHEDHFPKGNEQMAPDPKLLKGRRIGQDFLLKDGWRMYHGSTVPGFPSHPHRGFETVTVVRKGMVDHSDSMGAAGRYGDGDVQWMTAGKGIQHAEMFPLIHQDKDNPLELFQIWLNLPKANKFVEPYFKMLWSDTIPKPAFTDKNGKQTKIEIIAGELDGKSAQSPPPDSWAANKSNHLAIWHIQMEAGAKWTLPKVPAGTNRTIYVFKGKGLKAANASIENYHSADLEPEFDIELENGTETSCILLLQGRPIREPVVQYGPFVMNTKQEIQEAFNDYQRTQFGGWPWQANDPVHQKEKGRFALHADGKLETRS